MVARILIYLAVAGVLALGGYVLKVVTGDPDTAGVGDCLIDAAANDIKIVKCDDPRAVYKVEGKVGGITESDFQADEKGSVCKDYPATETGFWSGEKGGKGAVLCLSKLK